jgi:hypothetical protein
MTNRDALQPLNDANGLVALVAKVNDAQSSAQWVPVFRQMLAQNPGLWRYAGDLAHETALRLIKSAHGSVAFAESLERGLLERRAELGYETAPGLEKMLIEEVILCWLQLRLLDQPPPATTVGSFAFKPAVQPDERDERRARAQHAFLRACESLARVRKLAQRTPELMQINIGAQQVNVGQVRAKVEAKVQAEVADGVR